MEVHPQISSNFRDLLIRCSGNSARSATRHVLAIGLLTTSHGNILPSPVRTASLTAEDVCVFGGRGYSASNTGDGEISDRDAGGWVTGRTAVFVILLDNNAILQIDKSAALLGHQTRF